ncbi:hypothetical protein BXZ70DRAFT_473868 [Cristinia sonorae]|uniref:Uncharacterized protein n=1 Tax=Cristinia sonorae TaxID=1940300 RepID=A0A8K0XM78_9AGAR|nr:hypothetical protein BXZ70DRAFT_473868 [Cristinia sonorae]
MALVHNAQLVQCRRCGSKIKLSLKSFWDPFHWIKHKERCLKKPNAVVQEMRDASDLPQQPESEPDLPQLPPTPPQPAAPKPSWPTEVKVYSSSNKRLAPSPSLTPPLIPDEEDEEEYQSTARPSRSPEVFPKPVSSRRSRTEPSSPSPTPASFTPSDDLGRPRPQAKAPKDEFRDYLCHHRSPPTSPSPQLRHSAENAGVAVVNRRMVVHALRYTPYFAAIPSYDDDGRCCSPPLSTFQESKVRFSPRY